MPDVAASPAREQYASIEARLGQASTPAERDALKREIYALFKGVEQQIGELTALKDDIMRLVDRWKSAQGATAPSQAPQFGEELSPNDPQSESLLGWAQMLQEKYDDALLNFQKVLMRQPANALARINVGYICLKKRIFGEAIEHLSKAIRLDNDRKATLYAHFYLGLVYLEREMYEDAQTFFAKTLALGPNLIEAYYELGRAQWFNGERDAAVKTWRDGFAANKFNPWGKRCAETLQLVEQGGEPPRST
jgi:tetratricopeptide (TPR) repeat protein